MGDIAEDVGEAMRVINAYADEWVDYCAIYGYHGGEMPAEADRNEHDQFSFDHMAGLRKEMEETLRALIDPRACP